MPDLPEIAYLLFWTYKKWVSSFLIFSIFPNANRRKTTQFTHFQAPGMLKTAPACIFHHNWYGKTKIPMTFDNLHWILQHIVFYIIYMVLQLYIGHFIISYKKESPVTPWRNPLPGFRPGPWVPIYE